MKFTAEDGSSVTLSFQDDLLITEYRLGAAVERIRTRGSASDGIIIALKAMKSCLFTEREENAS